MSTSIFFLVPVVVWQLVQVLQVVVQQVLVWLQLLAYAMRANFGNLIC